MSCLMDDLSDDRFRLLLRHWIDIRGDRAIPYRHDIDPVHFAPCLPNMWIYRLDARLGEFVCDLAGEEVNTVWGRSIIGHSARTFMGDEEYERVHQRWAIALETPAIAYSIKKRVGKFRLAERLSLPILDRDGNLNCFVGMALFSFADPLVAQMHGESVPLGNPRYYDCSSLELIDMS